jgi:tetratricopeptide (TPR) repeat protein
LTEFARKLVLASSPGIPQTLEPDSDSDTSPIIGSYVIDNLDDILFPALSTDKPAPRQQEAITKPNQCSETDIVHAYQALREGERLAASQQYLDAIGYIVMARDIVSAFKQISVEAIDLYSRASFYLGLVYSRCGKLEIAELSISRAEMQLRYHTEIKIETTSQHFGRFNLALGIIKANSPEHGEETIHLLERAGLLFAQDLADNESENDWTAITSLKLADQFLACKQFQEAHNHLQKTIEHFQPQSTLSAQAQTCRALHRKALIHEAEGKNFERSMFMGAAKETWKHVRSAQQTADQSLTDDATLRREDFDNAIPEFWLR